MKKTLLILLFLGIFMISFSSALGNISYGTGTETNGGYINARNNIVINVTTTDATVGNITIYLYNSAEVLINSSFNTTATDAFVNFTGLSDGTYYFNATGLNASGTANSTSTYTVYVNKNFPVISYGTGTETTGTTLLDRKNLTVNLTATDTFLANVTIYLYNSTGIYNTTSSTGPGPSPYYVTFFGLADDTYYINGTSCDFGNQCNNSVSTLTIIISSPRLGSGGGSTGNICTSICSAHSGGIFEKCSGKHSIEIQNQGCCCYDISTPTSGIGAFSIASLQDVQLGNFKINPIILLGVIIIVMFLYFGRKK